MLPVRRSTKFIGRAPRSRNRSMTVHGQAGPGAEQPDIPVRIELDEVEPERQLEVLLRELLAPSRTQRATSGSPLERPVVDLHAGVKRDQAGPLSHWERVG